MNLSQLLVRFNHYIVTVTYFDPTRMFFGVPESFRLKRSVATTVHQRKLTLRVRLPRGKHLKKKFLIGTYNNDDGLG